MERLRRRHRHDLVNITEEQIFITVFMNREPFCRTVTNTEQPSSISGLRTMQSCSRDVQSV